ncbi:Protein of unknown function (DUF3605) [Geosmithia morbida]|uniref:N-acetylglucosamine-induced protein 1 n=1 Tax=Geosmithia morbida TaxID=1094350 RepID=A0A9P5D640_9HYPO|nr:Protein of unknown function (DUF3605) [Geosmithia morbida]KAF4123109.1 Protein of unknown function (DUF3605) [Geosmithia morbida]
MGDIPEQGVPEKSPFPLTEVDKRVLCQTDEEFKRHDWDNLKELIDSNQLVQMTRTPSELRRYMAWSRDTKAEYGSITAYMLEHRLPKAWGRPPFSPASTVPFADPSDYAVLINDWPYATEPGIVHIVVWTRTPIATTPGKGDMTAESRRLIRNFVQSFFIDQHPAGSRADEGQETNVIWFKNWVALQSVRDLEHFHVFVRDVDDGVLERWTGQTPKRSADGHHLSR